MSRGTNDYFNNDASDKVAFYIQNSKNHSVFFSKVDVFLSNEKDNNLPLEHKICDKDRKPVDYIIVPKNENEIYTVKPYVSDLRKIEKDDHICIVLYIDNKVAYTFQQKIR